MSAHIVLLHPALSFSNSSERLLATAHAIRNRGDRVTIASSPGSRWGAARAAGFPVIDLELPARGPRHAIAWLRMRRALAELEPDLLHASDASLAGLTALFATLLNLPYLLEVHGSIERRLPIHTRLCRTVLVPSDALREAAVNHGRIPKALVRVVPNAPTDHARPEAAPVVEGCLPVVGCSGHLDDSHDTDWFLDAARLLDRTGISARFVILGEGPREEKLRRRIRMEGMAEKVTLCVPTTPEAATSIAAFDAYVSCRTPGPGWLDAEALLRGVPCIFSAVGEAFGLVTDRTSGVLARPGDPQGLADEIAGLLREPRAAQAMGRAGRAFILERQPSAAFELDMAELHAAALNEAARMTA